MRAGPTASVPSGGWADGSPDLPETRFYLLCFPGGRVAWQGHSDGDPMDIQAIFTLLASIALRCKWSVALALVWLFNIIGTIDLADALRHVDVAPRFGAAW